MGTPNPHTDRGTLIAARGMTVSNRASRHADLSDVVMPDKAQWWRTTRAVILAVGPVLTLTWLASMIGSVGGRSAAIGAVVALAAWSPAVPAGAHALLCVDERAEILPWASTPVRELLAWPTMLLSGRARAETWISTVGVAAGVVFWAVTVGW